MSKLLENTKKGRTLKVTVDNLMKSKRMQIAIHNYNRDPKHLEAILIELGMEAQRVAKTAVIRTYNNFNSLPQFEMLPLLRRVDTFDTYNIYWSLSSLEQKLYMLDPKLELDKEIYEELYNKLKAEYGFE